MSEMVTTSLPRAGFWRRLAGLVIDLVIVTIPLQIIVAILFAQTNGAVQGAFGIIFRACAPLSANQLPADLQPPPPVGFNTISVCRVSFLGFDTARYLQVGRTTTEGSTTTAETRIYTLGADGRLQEAFSTNWIAIAIFFIYLIAMEHRAGATYGKRTVRIGAIDIDAPSHRGIPLRKAVLRQLAILIGLIPMAALGIAILALIYLGGIDLLDVLSNKAYLWLFVIAGLIEFAWMVWIVISAARKQDPIHDRLAGTAVVLK